MSNDTALHHLIGACIGAAIMWPEVALFEALNGNASATSHRIAEGIDR